MLTYKRAILPDYHVQQNSTFSLKMSAKMPQKIPFLVPNAKHVQYIQYIISIFGDNTIILSTLNAI